MSRYQLDAYAANERALAEMTSFVRSSFRFRDPLQLSLDVFDPPGIRLQRRQEAAQLAGGLA